MKKFAVKITTEEENSSKEGICYYNITDIQYKQSILVIYSDSQISAWRKPIGEKIIRSALILYT